MSERALPKVSIIMPTLNAAALLDNCLASIARQTYPRDRMEILLADAHSKDATRDIARKYGTVVIDDNGRDMEQGKRLALQHATGDYIVFVDADNELTHPDYLELAVRGLEQNPQALGVESYYLPSAKMSSFCAYVTHLLHISDPICWLMSANPFLVARDGEIERWTLREGSFSYPLGANGFVFRRADLDAVKAKDQFQDTHIALHLMRAGKREWLRVRGRGVHHYYVQTLWGFLQKRRRATVHFLNVQQDTQTNWMREKPPVSKWLAAVYCVTFVGPVWHTLRGMVRDRNPRWLWHVPASVTSVLGVVWGVWTHKRRKGEKKLIADLQVKQTLREFHPVSSTSSRAVIHLITNGVFTTSIAGGDIHFLKLAEGAASAGYELNFFGGHALKEVIEKHKLPGTVTLTDDTRMPKVNQGALGGQFAMFRDMFGRYRRTMSVLGRIKPGDFAYAVSDYWFDVLPVVRSASLRKLMVLHMEAPNFGQIVTRGRPDVDPKRLASLHYWASQEWSLRRFCACSNRRHEAPSQESAIRNPQSAIDQRLLTSAATGVRKHLFHLHPLMVPRLKKLGVRDDERTLLSYGLEVGPTDAVPAQPRVYDVVWIGRVHRQKGIDDLLDTLVFLNGRLPGLRAMFIGNVRDALQPEIAQRGLEKVVEFSGFVSEEEKIRLFKASRVFLMPSKHEGSPRVIGESIIAGTPVVAYDIPNYRPLFGDFACYAPPFDLAQFQQVAEREITAMRAGNNYLDAMDLAAFKRENSWETTQGKFLAALERMRA